MLKTFSNIKFEFTNIIYLLNIDSKVYSLSNAIYSRTNCTILYTSIRIRLIVILIVIITINLFYSLKLQSVPYTYTKYITFH